jgi:hypothetical protein
LQNLADRTNCSAFVPFLLRACSAFVRFLFREQPIPPICTMDDKYREILKALPESPPRSCLDPFREFISELHRRGRTYREVAHILANHCDIRVSVSTVYRFLHTRARAKPHSRSHNFSRLPEMTKGSSAVQSEATAQADSEKTGTTFEQIHRRIESLKSRQPPSEMAPKLFDYDPEQPLQLRKKTGASEKP